MTKFNTRKLHLACRSAVLVVSAAVLMPSITIAQDTQPEDSAVVEEIVVTGFRGSILAARDAKRESDSISDSIIAEDIGKSTDENIAEALSRVTGISLQSVDGIGSTVTIRGIDPNLNSISLNGVELGSAGDGRAVDLRAYSADILSKIEVLKTSSADHNEGSLGGSVNLITSRPLDRSERTTGAVQWRGTDFDGEDDYKYSFGTSKKFLDDTFGIATTIVKDSQFRRSDYYDTFDWRIDTYIDPVSLQTGETLDGAVYGVQPRFITQKIEAIDLDTTTANTVFQWQPSESTNLYLDLSYSDMQLDRDRHLFQEKNWHRNSAGNKNPGRPLDGGAILDESTNTFVFNASDRVAGLIQAKSTEEERTTFTGSLGGDFTYGPWSVDTRVNYTQTDQDIPVWNQANFQGPISKQLPSDIPAGFSCGSQVDENNTPVSSGGTVVGSSDMCSMLFGSWFNPIDAPENGPKLSQVRVNGRESTDETTSFFLDVDYELDTAGFTSLEFGAKYSDRSKNRFQNDVAINLNNTEVNPGTILYGTEGITDVAPFSEGYLGDQSVPGQVQQWRAINLDAVLDMVFPGGIPATSLNPLQTWDISEEIFAFYAKANFSFMDDTLLGNVGVRYVDTEVEGNGSSGFTFRSPWPTYFDESLLTNLGCSAGDTCFSALPVNETKNYAELLPSLNLTYLINDDMLLRLAASKTMARPSFNDLRPGGNVDVKSFSETTFKGGNTHLDPLVSTNYDLSWEWYYGESNLLSAAVFYKDMKDFVFTTTTLRTMTNPLTGEPLLDETQSEEPPFPVAGVLSNQAVNGAAADILGVELAVIHNFDNLPGLLSGLGVMLNYTYADSEADYDAREGVEDPYDGYPLTNTSEHTYNATAFWEDERLSARLAYNYRTERLIRAASVQMSTWADSIGTLDASFSYKINNNVSITANAVNLTDEAPRQFQTVAFVTDSQSGVDVEGNFFDGGYDGRTNLVNYYGRTFRVGIRVNF
jgi:TonB-dependent receptor